MSPFLSRIAIALSVAITLAPITPLHAKGVPITLLHVNDTHSHLDAIGPKDALLDGSLGGIARAATVIGSIRATTPNVLLVHAGDLFQGDPLFNAYFGVPELQIMRSLGFDAMAIGNHEFDLGPELLRDVLGTAFASGGFPLLSANLDLTAFPALGAWIKPATVVTIAGVKVGIIGMTVPNNPTNRPAPVVILDNVVEIVQTQVADIRAAGADVVIVLSHLGISLDESVAKNVTGIDMIIGGHDHLVFTTPKLVTDPVGSTVRIFQAGEHYKYMGKLEFSYESGRVTFDDYAILTLDTNVTPAPAVQDLVEQLKAGTVAQFGDLYNVAIGSAVGDITRYYDPNLPQRDTALGNLVTDAYRARTGTDLGIAALGLISERIYSGPIVGADVFRSVSYGYDIPTGFGLRTATMDISGVELVKGMEIGLSQLGIGDDFFLQYSGMRFAYDPGLPVGQRVDLDSIRINGKKWNPEASYSLTVNTGIVVLMTQLGVQYQNLVLRDETEYAVVHDFIASLGRVNYHSQGRIREKNGSRDTLRESRPVRKFSAARFVDQTHD